MRTWLITTPNGKPWQRMLNYASFAASAAARGMLLQAPDVVIATSPQLLVGLSGWWLSRIKRRPLVLEVRDLWPESLVASGVGRTGGRLIGALDRLAEFLYRRADLVVTVTEAQRDNLLRTRGLPPEKVRVIENGVETELFRPLEEEHCRRELRIPAERFVVSYTGTLGLAHGLGMVLDAAEQLKDRMPQALFLIVGEGAERESLVAEATRRGLHNVHFVRQQPRDRMPLYIGASNVCLVTLRKSDVFKTVIPSKMLEFMACARPIALAVDGQARQVLEEAAAGVFTPPEDAAALAETLAQRYATLLAEVTGTPDQGHVEEPVPEERRAA